MRKYLVLALALASVSMLSSTSASAGECAKIPTIVGTSWVTDTTQFIRTVSEVKGYNKGECIKVKIRDAGTWAWSMTKALKDPNVVFTGGFEGLASLLSDASSGAYTGELPVIAAVVGNSTFTLISSYKSISDLRGKIIVTGRCGNNWRGPNDPSDAGSPNVGTLMIVDAIRKEFKNAKIECSKDILGRTDLRSDTFYIQDGGSPKKRAQGLFDGIYAAAAILVEEQYALFAKEPSKFHTLVAPGAFADLPSTGVFVMKSMWNKNKDLICRNVRALQKVQTRFTSDKVWAKKIFKEMVEYDPGENYLYQRLALVKNDGTPDPQARSQAIVDLTKIASRLVYPSVKPDAKLMSDFYRLYQIDPSLISPKDLYVGDECFH